jgi:hypothetical protein
VNLIGRTAPQIPQRSSNLPVKLANATQKLTLSSTGGELNSFLSLLSRVIDKKTAMASTDKPQPIIKGEKTAAIPFAGILLKDKLSLTMGVDRKKVVASVASSISDSKGREAKTEKQSPASPDQLIAFEVPQFTPAAAYAHDATPLPAQSESKASTQTAAVYQGTTGSRALTQDVAFGLHLTKNQPASEAAAPASPDPPVDGSKLPGAALNPSPSTPPREELTAVPTADHLIPQDPKPVVRPEPSNVRAARVEPAIPLAPQRHSSDGNSSGNTYSQQKDSTPLFAPKQNQPMPVRNDDHPQTAPLSQFEMARTSEPQAARSMTNRDESTKVTPEPEINSTLQPQPARQISLKLSGPDSSKVDLLLTERAGKIQIAVRTGDHALAKSMQTDLTELVGRLEDKGFKAEAWIPTSERHVDAAIAPPPSNPNNRQSEQEQRGGWGQQQQQQRQGQNQSNHRQQASWKSQLEETTSAEQKRT